MKGDGHFALFGTLEIGHTLYPGVQRVQSWPFPKMQYYGLNREDFVFVRPPIVERFELAPNTVWYGRLKLLFSISIQNDLIKEDTTFDCTSISFCFEIKLDSSGMHLCV
jgi:hypothetical protein